MAAPRPEDFGAVPAGPDPSQFGATRIGTARADENLGFRRAQGFNEGAAGGLDAVLNAPQRVYNLGAEWWNQQEKPSSWPQITQYADPNYAQRAMSGLSGVLRGAQGLSPDIAEPSGPESEFARKIGQFAGASVLGGAKSITELIKNVLFGGLAGVGAEAGKETAKTLGAGPGGQALAEAAGSLAVPFAGVGAELGAKRLLRGGATPEQIAANAATIEAAGATPTVAQVTQSPTAKGIEYGLAKAPIAGTPILVRAKQSLEAVRQNLSDISQSLSQMRDKASVGTAIQTDMKDFMERSSKEFAQIDQAVKDLAPAGAAFGMDNTMATLNKLSKVSPEVPGLSGALKDPTINSWKSKLATDLEANGGKVSLQTLLDVRADIGQYLDRVASGVTADKGTGQYKAIYKSLSEDIKQGLVGSAAEPLMAQRDNYWKSYRDKVDNFIGRIASQPDQTRAYIDAISRPNLSPRQISEVRSSTTPETWKSVAAARIAEMGGADLEGASFSLPKFVSEYRKMGERPAGSNAMTQADALFGGVGTLKQDLDKIAAASELITKAGPQYRGETVASPYVAGTLGGLAGGTVFTSLFSGKPGMAAMEALGAVATVGAGRYAASKMVDPNVIKWLASSTSIPAERAQQWLIRLTPVINDITSQDDRKRLRSWQQDQLKRVER